MSTAIQASGIDPVGYPDQPIGRAAILAPAGQHRLAHPDQHAGLMDPQAEPVSGLVTGMEVAHQRYLQRPTDPRQPLTRSRAVGVHQPNLPLGDELSGSPGEAPMGSKIKTGRLPSQQQAEGLDHGFYPEGGRLCRQRWAIAPEQRRKPAAIEVGQQIQQAAFAAADPVLSVVNQQNRGCVHPLAPFGGTAGNRVAS